MRKGFILFTCLVTVYCLSFSAFGEESVKRKVRQSVLTGTWYAGNEKSLKEQVDSFISQAKVKPLPGGLAALICPHAGHIYSGKAAAYGYALLKSAPFSRVIILGPSHYYGFSGIALPDATDFQTPLGLIEVDREACDALLKEKSIFTTSEQAHSREHSIEIQLPFIQRVLPGCKIVPL